MLVVGIDPGVTGAIACVDSHGTCAVEDLPVIEMGGAGRTQRKLCGRGLAELVWNEGYVYRRRECGYCGHRVTTKEQIVKGKQ